MNNGRPGIFIIMFLFSILGLWQFSQAVRAVDVVGLFASGALAGAARPDCLCFEIKNNDLILVVSALGNGEFLHQN